MDPATATATINVASTAAQHSGVLSFLSMFLSASIAIQCVILVLLAASFWSWTIIFSKLMHLRRVKYYTRRFEKAFWSGTSLDALYGHIGDSPDDPCSAVFVVAMREWKRALDKGLVNAPFDIKKSLKERIERLMSLTATQEMRPIEKGIPFLATVSSSTPFIGLFGMVWGVMTSFESIGLEQNASIATVAPAIAEALFTTALGLLACIPSVIAYNKLSREVDIYAARLDGFIDEFLVILSRQIEEKIIT
ncbi:MAG: protein TolQ [Holosporales bacterium]|jgi:biopolymer transport protein TolQ|nr:protein TolQ [Holosporales bacterium]